MASTFNRPLVDVVKRRPLLRNKQANYGFLKPGTRSMFMKLSQMSPEAQRAMAMTQGDAKENISSTQNTKLDYRSMHGHNQGKDTGSTSGQLDVPIIDTNRDSGSCSRVFSRPTGVHIRGFPRSRRITASSFGNSIQTGTSSIQTVTSRSRSTISTTDRNNSINDNTDNCYNNNNNTTKINGSRHRNSLHNKDSDNANNNPTTSPQIQELVQNSTDESNNNNTKEVNNDAELQKDKETERPESFVLALDRALEDSCISRLSGDVTNTSGISELWKVRALDGGRLTNAQEVVVNVRYDDDDKELIFHDNDEESMSNAKATSNIRISLWMKYNEGFQPDDIADDVEVVTTNDNENKADPPQEATPPSEPATSLPKPTGRNVNKLSANRPHVASKNSNKNKWTIMKKDLNNNKTTSKSKTNNLKNTSNSSSRNGTADINNDIKRNDISSFTTEIKK